MIKNMIYLLLICWCYGFLPVTSKKHFIRIIDCKKVSLCRKRLKVFNFQNFLNQIHLLFKRDNFHSMLRFTIFPIDLNCIFKNAVDYNFKIYILFINHFIINVVF